MADIFQRLPSPLTLLVHLHLLGYPLANNAEYDQNIFDSRVRGLRDRTRTMEDVCFFLVEKVERKKEKAKSILSMYPCASPADTNSFRTSLSKYIEALRHSAVFGKVATASDGREKGKGKDIRDTSVDAWWWKDVVVRKSLLEECSGERFEQLILSFSTHALMIGTYPTQRAVMDFELRLQTQPKRYSTLLSSATQSRQTWEATAALTQIKENELRLIRSNITSSPTSSSLEYQTLTVEELSALFVDKRGNLLQKYWQGAEGSQALDWVFELFGLDHEGLGEVKTEGAEGSPLLLANNQSGLGFFNAKNIPMPVQPLPVAAALHPANLHKLKLPVFPPSTIEDAGVHAGASSRATRPAAVLKSTLSNQKRLQLALKDGLARSKKAGDELRSLLSEVEAEMDHSKTEKDNGIFVGLNLWTTSSPGLPSNSYVTPNEITLTAIPGHEAFTQETLDRRVQEIRSSLSSTLSPRPPVTSQGQPDTSYLPQRTASEGQFDTEIVPSAPFTDELLLTDPSPLDGDDVHSTLNTPRKLITSTPPRSVKPRSAYARRVLASQSPSRVKGRVSFAVTASGGLRRSRKSVRMSFASTSMRRPSLFEPPTLNDGDEENHLEDADEILEVMNDDDSTSLEEAHTPRPGMRLDTYTPQRFGSVSLFKRVNFTPTSGPRPSFKIVERLSLVPLPDEYDSADDLLNQTHVLESDIDDEWEDEQEGNVLRGPAEDYNAQSVAYEGRSFTLQDILLQAGDVTNLNFELLGADESLHEGTSLGWEGLDN